MQASQFPISSAFDTETMSKSADVPATPFHTPAGYFKNKRLVLQSKMVLESAWLLFQEANTLTDPLDTNTVKSLARMFKNNQMGELQKKMRIIRSKWLPNDNDCSLTLHAIKAYDSIIKCNRDIAESKILTGSINAKLSFTQANP